MSLPSWAWRSERCTPISMPAIRTAWREACSRVHVAELAQRDQRGDLAHPVLGHQRPAAGLSARERSQIPLDLGELCVEQVDDLKRDLDPLARVDGQLETGEELAAG